MCTKSNLYTANRVKKTLFIMLFWVFFTLACSNFCYTNRAFAEDLFQYFEYEHIDHLSERFFAMKDLETGESIMKSARIMNVDDEYINQDNKLYRVEKVEDNIAWARFIEEVQLAKRPSIEAWAGGSAGETIYSQPLAQQQEAEDPVVGVFHSHGAEAYVPSDGEEFVLEGGGILDVGRSFVEALEEKGMEVNFSTDTHVPHDAGAYQRSRRTVEELLREGSNVLFDLHRDAVPAEEYKAQVNGEEKVQIQFVVGRQNQNVQTNREFAESLKSVVDENNPGLIKGIFMAQGNYNQDVLPLSLLLEVGSHENTREGAESSAALFADSTHFYLTGEEAAQVQEGLGMTALRGILWVIFVLFLALGVYLLISTGSKEELKSKLKQFFSREFLDLTRRRGNRKDGDNQP